MHSLGRAFLCLLAAISTGVVSAAEVTARDASVVVNGVSVIQYRASVQGMSPQVRAQAVAAVLATLDDRAPVRLTIEKNEAQISLGPTPCVTVTRLDARAYRTSVGALARIWSTQLGEALSLPPIKSSVTSLLIPVGASRTITLTGSRASFAVPRVEGSANVTAERTPAGIQIRGTGTGTATVVLEAGSESATIAVSVRPTAATFPQTLAAEVVGAPAAGTAVSGAIETILRQNLRTVPGATITYEVPKGAQLAMGESRTYSVKVRVNAAEAFTSSGMANIVVRNLPLSRRPDAELWYSNDPEIVKTARPLFSAALKRDTPTRLLYHHVNGASYPMFLRVQAVNDSDAPARVVVMPGDSRPDRNPVWAGLQAATQYLTGWMAGSGEVVTIPPRSTLPISLRRLGPGETASGLCGLRLLEGTKPLLIRTDSWPPFPLDRKWTGAVASSTPWREVGCPAINDFDLSPYMISEHVYPNPQKQEELKYAVGGRHGFVRIGQRAIMRQDASSRLDGNFGVIYSIKGSLTNPTAAAVDVEVVFEASAGYSGGLFLVNGLLVRTELLQPKSERRLARIRLEAGAARPLSIITVPLSGSSYPATIMVRPVSDQAEVLREGVK